jgi:hypothetical protein
MDSSPQALDSARISVDGNEAHQKRERYHPPRAIR